MKSPSELKQLHGQEYVDAFEAGNASQRLERLITHMQFDGDYDVADFACGSGLLMEHVAPRVKSYVGVDFSEPFISVANDRKQRLGLANANFHCADIVNFCASHPQEFDIGFAMDFSEHVYDDNWVEILRAIKSSLKDTGRMYLHTPNGMFFLEIMKQRNMIVKQFPGHIAVRTPDENTALIEKAGLTVRRLLFLPHYNVLRFLHPFARVPLVGKYFNARLFIEATA